MGTFILATANPHKLEEIRVILSEFPITPLLLADFPPVFFPEETGTTYEDNALRKAVHVARSLQLPAIGDDSGLEVEALAGQPGVHSSRFLGKQTSYDVKNARILELLEKIPAEKRKAKFVCAAAAAFPDGRSFVARGEVAGTIALEAHGAGGFGYDPIFFLPEYGKTMAELSPEEKNRISHRAKAFQALVHALTSMQV